MLLALPETSVTVGWAAGALLLFIFAYVVVRIASFAYFRTKLEFLRSALTELRKEKDRNG